MKRNRLLTITAAVLILCLSTALNSFAASDFIIRDYDIKMVVNEDDTYQITETLDVEFTAPSHGIYRSIPGKTRIDRDGQVSEYFAKVKGFEMLSGQPFSDESDSSEFLYRIGDADKYAETDTRYQYTYIYDTNGDHFKGGDEVYHNMVGTTWEAQSIDHVSFEIVFPEAIDAGKVGIKTGNNTDVPFKAVDDRTIRGETDEDVMGGLTVRAVLPEGYFTREAKDPAWIFYAVTAALAALAAAGFVMWRKYGRDPVYPVPLEMYPPDGLSAPEIAYLANESISDDEIISILLTLADKGYLKIHEYEAEKGRRHKLVTKYRIEKLRDYDGNVIGERTFMNGLFSSGDEVEVEDLEDKFYLTAKIIKEEIEEKYAGKLYDETASGKANLMYIAGTAGIVALVAVARLTAGGGSPGLLSLLMALVFIAAGFYSISDAVKSGKGPFTYLISLLIACVGLGFAWSDDIVSGWQMLPFGIGLLMCLLLFIMAGLCEKKTDYYAELQARIKGYTDFLKTAEKDQMEELAERDPDYYFRNLAFAFALGVTSVYAKRFAGMVRKAPDWYDSHYYYSGTDSTERMLDSINNMASSVSSSMSSSSDGSGGGSFSGGGGGGGGGGGSW